MDLVLILGLIIIITSIVAIAMAIALTCVIAKLNRKKNRSIEGGERNVDKVQKGYSKDPTQQRFYMENEVPRGLARKKQHARKKQPKDPTQQSFYVENEVARGHARKGKVNISPLSDSRGYTKRTQSERYKPSYRGSSDRNPDPGYYIHQTGSLSSDQTFQSIKSDPDISKFNSYSPDNSYSSNQDNSYSSTQDNSYSSIQSVGEKRKAPKVESESGAPKPKKIVYHRERYTRPLRNTYKKKRYLVLPGSDVSSESSSEESVYEVLPAVTAERGAILPGDNWQPEFDKTQLPGSDFVRKHMPKKAPAPMEDRPRLLKDRRDSSSEWTHVSSDYFDAGGITQKGKKPLNYLKWRETFDTYPWPMQKTGRSGAKWVRDEDTSPTYKWKDYSSKDNEGEDILLPATTKRDVYDGRYMRDDFFFPWDLSYPYMGYARVWGPDVPNSPHDANTFDKAGYGKLINKPI